MKKIAPKHPQTLYLQALLAFREKNYVAAREAIQLQLRAAPDNLPGLVLDGSIEYHLGAYAQAETSLQKALQQAPKERLARMMLVNTYLRNRQPAKALEALKPLLRATATTTRTSSRSPARSTCRTATPRRPSGSSPRRAALDPKDTNKRTALALDAHVVGRRRTRASASWRRRRPPTPASAPISR